MTLLEKLTEYRRALYVYRALRENRPKLGMMEPSPCYFGLCGGEGQIKAMEVRREVLSDKKLENEPNHEKS